MGGWSGITTVAGSGNSDTVTGAGQTYTLDDATANAGSNGTVAWTSIENLTDSGAGIFQMGTGGSVAGTLTAVGGTVSYATRTGAASFALGGGASTGMGGWSGITTVAGSGNSDTVTGAGQTYTLDDATANAGSNGTVAWTSIENLTDSGAGIFQMGTGGSVAGTLTAVGGTVSYATRTGAASFALGGGASTGMGGWSGITTVAGSGNSDTVTGAGQTYTLDDATANAGSNGTVAWTSIENLTDSGAGIFQMGTGGSVAGTLTAVGGTVSYATRTGAASFALGGGASTGMGGWSGITTVAGSGNSDTVTGAGGTYNLTGVNSGNDGTVAWTSIENLTATGVANLVFAVGSNLGGNLNVVAATIGGTVSTGGDQIYAGPVTLNSATTLTSSGGGSINFGGTVDGAQDLTVNTAGTTTFVGAVGGVVALTSLATDAAGTTTIGGGLVQTSGSQTYNDPVSGSAILTVTGVGDISAANPGNSFGALTLNGVNALIHNAGGITLGTSTLTGYLDLVAGGDIGQSGILTAANLWASSSGNILLKNANVLGGTVSLIAGAGGEVWLNSDRIAVGTVRPSDGSTTNVGISGERVTLQAPSAAAFITTGVEGEVSASAALSAIPALTILANGVIGNAGAPTTQGLRVRTSGLVRVVGDALGDGSIFLIGDEAIQPKYEFSGDPLHRIVKYNGADAANAQLTGALDAAYLDIRNQTTEIRESGFAKENASKVLRRGVVTSAGPGQPAVDDSTGMAGLESCDGNFGGSTLSCQ
ncbi:MAG: hypothetical protein IPL72_06255 [Sulfuritalea sp.]|nr:hypothetical protein [Sulfuritalea sp.]